MADRSDEPVGHSCLLCMFLSRKNNVWPVNGHPMDSPAWFLASAHGQKWIRTGPHNADTGASKSTSPVICVQLIEPKGQELPPILSPVCVHKYVTNIWMLSSDPSAKVKHSFLCRVHPGDK